MGHLENRPFLLFLPHRISLGLPESQLPLSWRQMNRHHERRLQIRVQNSLITGARTLIDHAPIIDQIGALVAARLHALGFNTVRARDALSAGALDIGEPLLETGRPSHGHGHGQRWVIAIYTKIQLPNTLPIILNCVI